MADMDIVDIPGIEMTLDEASARVQERFPGSSYMVVRDWYFGDPIVPDELKGQCMPVMFAKTLVYDSDGLCEVGEGVRSGRMVEFLDDCLFCTRDCVYVLVGKGQRGRYVITGTLNMPCR